MRHIKMIERRIPTTESARPNPAPPTASLPPAVPISVYRQLSADLQATTANVAALEQENQQLTAQNQQLRQDLVDLANQTQTILQKIQAAQSADMDVDAAVASDQRGFDAESAPNRAQMLAQLYRAMPNYAPPDRATVETPAVTPVDSRAETLSYPSRPHPPKSNMPKVKRSKLVAEQAQTPLRSSSLSLQGRQLSGWKLTLIMALVVVSAFGAGFLLVRPLISSNSSR